MIQPKLLRPLIAMLIATLFFAPMFAGAARTDEGGAGARAADTEPANNSPNTPTALVSDDYVLGSLMSTALNDYQDWYIIQVPLGKVLNISMCIENWTADDNARYNLDLLGCYVSGGNLYILQDTLGYLFGNTRNKWESGYFFNNYGNMNIYILVAVSGSYVNPPTYDSLPSNYTLSAVLTDPIPYAVGDTSAKPIDKRNGPNAGYFYSLGQNPIPLDKMMDAKLQCPQNGDFDMYVYEYWEMDQNALWQRNGSWANASGNLEQVIVGGNKGTYYLEVRGFDGAGTYSLTSLMRDAIDTNNEPTKATFVRDNNWHLDSLDQGMDPVDYWTVNIKAGKNLGEAFFSLTGVIAENNLYQMMIFDQNLNLRAQKWSTENGSLPVDDDPPNRIVNAISIRNLPATADGPMYVMVRAVTHYGTPLAQAHCSYKMTFTLPNDPPALSAPIPQVNMDEDTVSESLVLSQYFGDPEGDKLAYFLVGSAYQTHPTVDNETGLVTLKPTANWSGTEVVRVKAIDDGPGSRSFESNFTVVVNPVNDPPHLINGLGDLSVGEDVLATTSDLSMVFGDIDTSSSDIKYNLKILSSMTHPPGSNLQTLYDPVYRQYKLGPAHLFYGTFQLQVTCTDGAAGTVPLSSNFNLTITHKNHRPSLRENIQDPMELTIKEHDKDSHLALEDLFTDLDLPEAYANDALTYSVTGAQKLVVSINEDGYLVIDTGKEQYYPGVRYEEKLLVTCKDKAGQKATLNITVLVEPVNDPPRIVNVNPSDYDVTMNENTRKVFSVAAIDDDTLNLTYSWYLNGKKDRNAKSMSFAFEPAYDVGGEDIYEIRVDCFDGTTTVHTEWNVTVNDVNRLPVGIIKAPLNMTKYKKGTFVTFTAEGTDEDEGDTLTFIWRDAAGVELGRGATFSTDKLPKGTQTITLETNDTKGANLQTVTVLIVTDAPPPETPFIPGFEGLFVVVALGATIALMQLRRRLWRA